MHTREVLMNSLRRSFPKVLLTVLLFGAAAVAGEFAGRLISPSPLSASQCEFDLCFNWIDEGECVDFGKPPFSANCNYVGSFCEMTPC
ncbi:hypothetical protein [Candidatus Palauibacter sp.]|uniref:hypothetical protein n=1 Tax=Candidatus Palauibacter sp. TaxID=3101350 RepID=UPI003AF1FDCF